MRGLLALASVLLVTVTACGAPAFNAQFQEREEPELTRCLRAVAEVESPPAGDPVVVLVRPEPLGLRAVSLTDGATRWEHDADVTTTPIVAGPFVVAAEGEAIIGRRLSDGQPIFNAGAGRLLGAHSDGARVVVSIAEGSEESPTGRLVMATEEGVVWGHELTLPVGVAAVANDVVVVPWATQRLSFLNAADGVERARLRFPSRVVGRAWVDGGRMLVGQHDVVQVGPELDDIDHVRAWQPVGRPLPGQPPIIADGYRAVPEPQGAHNRVRVVWRATPSGEMGAQDGVMYLIFYRLVFALDVAADEARWVHILPRDVIGATAVEGGLWIVADDGGATLLSAASGAERAQIPLGSPALAAAIVAGAAAPAEAEEEEPDVQAELLAAAQLDDNRLAAGRGLAARLLGGFEGAEVTGQLVDLCSRRASPEPARQAACEALTTRTTGPQHVRAALTHHGSFLADRASPPVGPLARAAASMQLRAAVPLLLRHLEDPATPAAELADLLQGLGELGVTSAAREIEAFVRLYHATADSSLQGAVIAGALAVEALDGRRGEALIASLRGDPLSPPEIGAAIERVHAERAAEAAQNERAAQRAQARSRAAEPTEAPAARDTRPERIDASITARIFEGTEASLRRCLEGDSRSLRISMVVNGDGEIGTIAVSPSESQACVEPIVRRLRFPETRLGLREQVVHQIRR